jgi:polysaccharide biosynthesis protein VpsQ
MRPRTFRLACLLGVVIHGVLLVTISAGAYLGILPTTSDVPHSDLVAHLVLFGILAFLLQGVLSGGSRLRDSIAPALVLVPAAVDEAAQALSPRRTADLTDFAADVVGVLLGWWLARLVYRTISAPAAAAPGESPPSESCGGA